MECFSNLLEKDHRRELNSAKNDVTVPFNDLGRGTSALRTEIDEAIARVLSSGWYVLGPEHDALESELSDYLGAGDAVLVGNGTDALQLALTSVGVTAGSTVLTVANAGGYTSTAARSLGAIPVYADVEPQSHLLSERTLNAALERLPAPPRALVITHLFGAAVDAEALVALAKRHDVAVIEDCAQALGASVRGAKVGTFGDVATTSFYPTKNLGALGDGGALFTSNPNTARMLRQLRQYGWESKYRASVPGGRNSRLDEMQAAILRVKLPHLDRWNERRREIHRSYEAAIGAGDRLLNTASERYVGHLAVLDTNDRERTQRIFDEAGVRTDVHYPLPDHLQSLASDRDRPLLPVTERAATTVLSIPLFPELRSDEIDRVCEALAHV